MKRSEYYEEKGLDRIINISDAIFAFSLTLLAADLIVPDLNGISSLQFSEELLGEIPKFLYFILTFLITWAYWIKHHRIFRFIKRYDDILVRLNMFFLLFIVLMPFITKVINEHSSIQIAVIIAAIGYAAPGYLASIMWHYASTNYRLIDSSVPHDYIRNTIVENYISPVIFTFSIFLSYIKPVYTLYCWVLLFPIGYIAQYRLEEE
nr:TMEM175 family protein [uncultured Methanospirillum sp.]